MMCNFIKTEKWLCVIPFASTCFIIIATMAIFKKLNSSCIYWLIFGGIFFTSGAFAFAISSPLIQIDSMLVKQILIYCVCTVMNILLIKTQSQCIKDYS